MGKKHGSFLKAMRFILKKLKNKKNRGATFVCSLTFKDTEKLFQRLAKLHGNISNKII